MRAITSISTELLDGIAGRARRAMIHIRRDIGTDDARIVGGSS
jgi:hypothetical protein